MFAKLRKIRKTSAKGYLSAFNPVYVRRFSPGQGWIHQIHRCAYTNGSSDPPLELTGVCSSYRKMVCVSHEELDAQSVQLKRLRSGMDGIQERWTCKEEDAFGALGLCDDFGDERRAQKHEIT